ncbi:MAG: hypothetical protein QM755_11100 [Luteolibacter sp.]
MKYLLFTFLFIAPLSSILHAEQPSPAGIPWPAGMEAKIDEAVSIKLAATKRAPNMRLKDDSAATAFAQRMDEIAVGLTQATDIESFLRKAEGTDLKASIGLWALDRHRHRENYTRLAAIYVYLSPEAAERQVSQPPKIKPGDLKEDQRLALEYLFFSPPGPKGFDDDYWRSNLAEGLRKIGEDKSIFVLRSDLQMRANLWPSAEEQRPQVGVEEGIEAIRGYRNAAAFRALAVLWQYPNMRWWIKIQFQRAYDPSINGLYDDHVDKRKADCEPWSALATLEWQTDEERALANFIKLLPSSEKRH